MATCELSARATARVGVRPHVGSRGATQGRVGTEALERRGVPWRAKSDQAGESPASGRTRCRPTFSAFSKESSIATGVRPAAAMKEAATEAR